MLVTLSAEERDSLQLDFDHLQFYVRSALNALDRRRESVACAQLEIALRHIGVIRECLKDADRAAPDTTRWNRRATDRPLPELRAIRQAQSDAPIRPRRATDRPRAGLSGIRRVLSRISDAFKRSP
jgi:hypothetical protein